MRDSLIAFVTAYQADPLHGPCEIKFPTRALDLNVSGADKVLFWPAPQGPPVIETIADGVDLFLKGGTS